ncbi:hypothetical protein OS493_039403 [Desmophyllum pertusum]|uniref:Uncharacterized protein n=1 Tax=Desmophyllum pertusum TaxID=174260 RepID=A0A9X0CIQ8_9CNID|nr:hypothetical protein OS493_039403 [Desmophyllum pertusum]
MAETQEMFFMELSQPVDGDELLPVLLLEMILKYCGRKLSSFSDQENPAAFVETVLIFFSWKRRVSKEEGRLKELLLDYAASYEAPMPSTANPPSRREHQPPHPTPDDNR